VAAYFVAAESKFGRSDEGYFPGLFKSGEDLIAEKTTRQARTVSTATEMAA